MDSTSQGRSTALVEYRPIDGLHLWRNDLSKSLVVNNSLVQFTPMECCLICHLLADGIVPDATLIATPFGSQQPDRSLLRILEISASPPGTVHLT